MFDIKYKGDFINGRFITVSKGDGEFKDVSRSDLNDMVMIVPFKHDHIDEACVAAKKAYPAWATLPMAERKNYLMRLKELFDGNAEQMAQIISRDTGKPSWEAMTEAKALGAKIDITLNHSLNLIAEERIPNALPQVEGVIRHRSRGVMAVVGPFNFPAHLPNGHIIPALIAGNTVVFKPSE